MVTLEPLLSEAEQEAKISREVWHMGVADEIILKRLIENHLRYTYSSRARQILEEWPKTRTKFVKVFPLEYKRALGEMTQKNRKIAA